MKAHDLVVEMEGPSKGMLILDGMKLCATGFSLSAGVDEITKLTVTLNVVTVNKPIKPPEVTIEVTSLGDSGLRRNERAR
ncbi:hypothetical protein [Achromobacter insolitus]|uniref:hypothetical protein n=1 Tax=Achromobacter insolitus TaxID=217204 RepID=UPI0020A2EF5E|nr:hypothetical protein [Achromobacter insolitus]MCP1404265.1 hypothetical protein [Achromobacter insolitus]